MPSRRSARRRRWVRGIVSPCVRRVAWRTISISMRGILRPLPSKEPHRETIEKIQKVSRERTYSDGRLHELVKRESINKVYNVLLAHHRRSASSAPYPGVPRAPTHRLRSHFWQHF